VLLKEALSTRELIGCAVVFCAVLMVEIVPTITEKRKAKAVSAKEA
jgi:drug/metabolite transporter (DMT)-like permease